MRAPHVSSTTDEIPAGRDIDSHSDQARSFRFRLSSRTAPLRGRQSRPRKPSSLGSYRQFAPRGSVDSSCASIGAGTSANTRAGAYLAGSQVARNEPRSVADALHARGVPEPPAALAAQSGLAVFTTRSVVGSEMTTRRRWRQLTDASLTDLRAVVMDHAVPPPPPGRP